MRIDAYSRWLIAQAYGLHNMYRGIGKIDEVCEEDWFFWHGVFSLATTAPCINCREMLMLSIDLLLSPTVMQAVTTHTGALAGAVVPDVCQRAL